MHEVKKTVWSNGVRHFVQEQLAKNVVGYGLAILKRFIYICFFLVRVKKVLTLLSGVRTSRRHCCIDRNYLASPFPVGNKRRANKDNLRLSAGQMYIASGRVCKGL